MTHPYRRQAAAALATIAVLLLLLTFAVILIVNPGTPPQQPVLTAGVPAAGPIAKVAAWVEPPPPPPPRPEKNLLYLKTKATRTLSELSGQVEKADFDRRLKKRRLLSFSLGEGMSRESR